MGKRGENIEKMKDEEIKVTIPLITNEEIKNIDNNLNDIVHKFIKMQIEQEDILLLQHIIEKQQNKIDKAFEYLSQFKNDMETGGVDIFYVLSILSDKEEI